MPERAVFLAEDAYALRGRRALDAILTEARKRTPVEVNPAADALMSPLLARPSDTD
jgi:hypothetical protein